MTVQHHGVESQLTLYLNPGDAEDEGSGRLMMKHVSNIMHGWSSDDSVKYARCSKQHNFIPSSASKDWLFSGPHGLSVARFTKAEKVYVFPGEEHCLIWNRSTTDMAW